MGALCKIFSGFILLACVCVQFSTQQTSSCPIYESCSLAGASSDTCDGTNPDDPCPGGRSSCFEGSCCCIKYNTNYRHLVAGSAKPPRTPEKLRVYFMRFCPYSQRVMLTSRAKNVTTDVVFINLKSKPDWFANGLGGKVPVIETDDGSINESLFEADFLDETYPVQGELYPANTFLKAVDRLWVDNYNKLIPGLIFEILQGKGYANPSEVPALMKQFEDGITKYGDELTHRGTTFFGGNGKPGMMDYMLWPWMERKPVLQMYYPNSYDYTKTSPRMAAWAEEMKKDEAVKTFGLAPQVHYEYVASVRAGNPNYDMLFGN